MERTGNLNQLTSVRLGVEFKHVHLNHCVTYAIDIDGGIWVSGQCDGYRLRKWIDRY